LRQISQYMREIATLRKQLTEAQLRNAHFLSAADPMGESKTFADVLERIRESRKKLTLTTCSKCGRRYENFTITNNDVARNDPPQSSVTKQELFEAALGTLSMVSQEVSELQAAKIRGAIDVLRMFADQGEQLCDECEKVRPTLRSDMPSM